MFGKNFSVSRVTLSTTTRSIKCVVLTFFHDFLTALKNPRLLRIYTKGAFNLNEPVHFYFHGIFYDLSFGFIGIFGNDY